MKTVLVVMIIMVLIAKTWIVWDYAEQSKATKVDTVYVHDTVTVDNSLCVKWRNRFGCYDTIVLKEHYDSLEDANRQKYYDCSANWPTGRHCWERCWSCPMQDSGTVRCGRRGKVEVFNGLNPMCDENWIEINRWCYGDTVKEAIAHPRLNLMPLKRH